MGWASLILLWTLFGLLVDVKLRDLRANRSLLGVVSGSPIFWSLLLSTVSVALPWTRLRRVAVTVEPLSSHATRLHFQGSQVPPCAAIRLSDRPLLEWHAFATIPTDDGQDFSVIVSKAGDWTARLIEVPQPRLWVRGVPTIGVLHMAAIFQKVVLVATGSGIGPILSLLGQRHPPCRILWSTPDPELTYSKSIVDKVRQADPDAVIFDTTRGGRPDLIRHSHHLYHTSRAEAVFIISNPQVTRRVVCALEIRGVPIFAPIFDS
jgi:predicted ferric reductase